MILVPLILALLATPVAQQPEMTVRGRVLDPAGGAPAGQRVVLHRVDQSGGATVAEATTSDDGTFTLTAPASADTTGVFFVAARYEGELYIGEPFRAGAEATGEQILLVGVPGTSATALLQDAQAPPPGLPGRPATTSSWLLLVVPLLGLAGVLLYFLLPRRRIAPDRALYIRIAEIDERMDAAPEGQRESLREERSRLLGQLREV